MTVLYNSTQKQPSCKKMVWPSNTWVKKVVKSKVVAKSIAAVMLIFIIPKPGT